MTCVFLTKNLRQCLKNMFVSKNVSILYKVTDKPSEILFSNFVVVEQDVERVREPVREQV